MGIVTYLEQCPTEWTYPTISVIEQLEKVVSISRIGGLQTTEILCYCLRPMTACYDKLLTRFKLFVLFSTS